jgi:flagellar hook-associated protein 1 FlgK
MPELLQLGVSALVASQSQLATTGHNISNVNTPGYSRQQTIVSTVPPQNVGVGFIGNGVQAEGIRRIVDDFTTVELRVTGGNFSRQDAIYSNAARMDNLLGDETTSLLPSLQNFFSAMQKASEDPASLATRQTVLSQSDLLVGRINGTYTELETRNETLNVELETAARELTALADGVAQLNERITVYAQADLGALPNDLMDERELLIQQISEISGVTIVENDDRTINLFLGNGQGLVVGADAGEVKTAIGTTESSRHDIVFVAAGVEQVITNELSGGKIGGILEFRQDVLDPVYNELGLMAIALSDLVNDQHRLGMDLDNQLGQDFFRDVNDSLWSRLRVIPDSGNALPEDRVIALEITDVSALRAEDYEVEFSGTVNGQYTVRRAADNSIVAQTTFSGLFPSTVEFEGLTMTLQSGSFQGGDRFTLQPYRAGAREIALEASNIRNVAFAQPVRIESSSTNRGTGSISAGEVLDTTTTYFANGKQLSPPLLVEFTSATTYQILDNSNSTTPQPLDPPLRNLTFVPGIENNILPADDNRNAVSSDGTAIGVAQRANGANGYASEILEFITIDPETQIISTQSLTTVADAPAATTATQLNGLTGVIASSRNRAVLSDFSSASPLSITLNGQTLVGDTADTLADAINSHTVLSDAGITALSNGIETEINADTGIDLVFSVTAGLATDSVIVSGENGTPITLTGVDATPSATVGGTIDLILDEGVSITGVAEVFSISPTLTPRFMGFQAAITGRPSTGDTFTINYNTDGFSDNRNALKLAALQTLKVAHGHQSTLRDIYSSVVDQVGTTTKQFEISREAALTLFERAQTDRQSTSGVSLDEEAVNLINFEQQYNAAAQLISVARELIDTLINSIG